MKALLSKMQRVAMAGAMLFALTAFCGCDESEIEALLEAFAGFEDLDPGQPGMEEDADDWWDYEDEYCEPGGEEDEYSPPDSVELM